MTTSKGKWDGLRDASFRGVPFFLVDTEGTGGRRAIPRAYPRRETAWTDDNGAVPGQQQINAKLPGKNFQDDLNALLDALNTPGPGELIHPWFGIQTVQVGKVTHRLSTEEDGIAYVTFEVFEAGERLFPSAADNTQQEVLTGIDAVKAAIDDGDWFGALDGLGEMADSFLADMENLVANLPTLPAALNQWMDRLNHFKEMAGTIIATPGRLVSELSSFIDGVVDLVTAPPRSTGGLHDITQPVGRRTRPTGCHRRTAGRYHREARQRGRRRNWLCYRAVTGLSAGICQPAEEH